MQNKVTLVMYHALKSIYMDIILTISPISPLNYAMTTSSSPSYTPPPPYPIMGHPSQLHPVDLYSANCLCCLHNWNLVFSLRDELHFMFSYVEQSLTPQPALRSSVFYFKVI